MLSQFQFLLYSKVAQLSYIHMPFLILSSIMVYPKRLNVVSVLYKRTSLLSHSNSSHLLTPNSPSIPLPPLSWATTSLSSMSVSLFLFYRQVHLCHILDSTYKWYHMAFVSLFLISLSMRIYSCIHVAINGIISFYPMAESYSIVYMYHIFSIHSTTDGHVGCCHVLAIVKSAAVNIRVHVSFKIIGFLISCCGWVG